MSTLAPPERLLDLSGNRNLTRLCEADAFRALSPAELAEVTSLDLSGCEALTSLQGIEQLTALTSLGLSQCRSLTGLQGIEHLTAMTSLDLSRCKALTSLQGIEPLTTLATLDLRWCESLTSLKGIEQLTALQELVLTRYDIALAWEDVLADPQYREKFTLLAKIDLAQGGLLGLLRIEWLEKVEPERLPERARQAVEIVNRYLPNKAGNKAIVECQSALLDADLEEFATL